MFWLPVWAHCFHSYINDGVCGAFSLSADFLYGFVLFRQQKDHTRSRGYFQKSVVMISEQPFVDLYERILRVIGPLYFQLGADVLGAVYDAVREW